MNKPAPINQTTFRILYYRNKAFIPSILIFIASIVIIFEAILPQVQQWITTKQEIAKANQQIDALNNSIAKFQVLNETQLDSQLSFLSKVLPQGKDYIGILSAVANAAINSGVQLGNYSFGVGDLSQGTISKSTSNTIQIKLSLKGGVQEVKKFISQLKNQTPLSDIADIQIGDGQVNILATFYFKPYPVITFDASTTISQLTAKEAEEIRTLQQSMHTSADTSIPSI